MGLPMTVSERRQTPRTALQEFAYINIEANNGGSVLNVSEGGFCFHSIAPVRRNGTIRFSISEGKRRIEATGKLAWTDETQKTGGVQFTALSAGAREQIRRWTGQSAASLSANKASAQSFPSLPAFLTLGAGGSAARTMPDRTAPFSEISPQLKVPTSGSGFSRGLAIGLLVSTFVAAVFLLHDYRRELGESLIKLGERFASKPEEQMQAAVTPASQANTPVPQTVAPAPQTVPPMPQMTSSAPRPVPPGPKALPPAPETVSPAPRTVSTQQTISPASQTSALAPRSVAAAPASIPVAPPEKLVPQPLATPAPAQQAKLEAPQPPNPPLTAAGSPATEAPRIAAPTIAPAPLPVSLPAATAATDSTHAADKAGTSPQVELASHPSGGEENAISQMFFEVGKSKDESAAQKETEQLAQFGFPANVVQKGHLWMSSYRVLVGPYANDEGAEAAHKNLLSRGFKPRPFERGSRTLTLRPGLTLNNARLAGGDCEISWESYIADATVKFEQDNYLVATANGHWIKRDSKYKRDAFVYRRNGDGSRTLLEIQFSGMSRALRFGPV
jgi:hypothetical protein